MATQHSRFPGTPRLDRRRLISGTRRLRRGFQVLALLAVCCFATPGLLPTVVRAAPAHSLACPTSPSPGVGECQGTVTSLVPTSFSPPSGGPIAWGGEWSACMDVQDASNYTTSIGQFNTWQSFVTEYRHANVIDETWSGNWILSFLATADGMILLENATPNVPQSVWSQPHPLGGPPCAPPQAPPMTSLPQIGSVFSFNFFAYAPIADISGTAKCPAGSPAGSWCPPSVGNPVTLTVTGFHSAAGPTSVVKDLGAVDGFADARLSLSWNLNQQVGANVWDFDDEQVDPTTGQAQRTPTVTSEVNQPVSHTFDYSSAFDPIRQCVRPCPGDLTGPPMAGYPNGTPAFQVQVSSHWNLRYTETVTDFQGQTATLTVDPVDLRQFGSPTPYFTSVTTVPLFVVSYGSVTP